MNRKEVSEEEWNAWVSLPVTQAYRSFLRELIRIAQQQWAEGVYTDGSVEGTAQLNAKAIGSVRTLGDLVDLDFEMFQEEL